MRRSEVIEMLFKERYIAVIRMKEDSSYDTISRIIKSGIRVIEITLTMSNAFELISAFGCHESNPVVGAGTVLDSSSAVQAIRHGAKFIVSPMYSEDVAHICNIYGVLYIPGVQSMHDIYKALAKGYDLLKLFPASQFKTNVISEIKGPFPQASFLISGKVTPETAKQWFNNRADILCLGSVITKEGSEIEKVVEQLIEERKNAL